MLPDSGLLEDVKVEEVDISDMLEVLNKRISVLLDREHSIGHSYFLPLKKNSTIQTLSKIFENRIIPLLQEYFYDDYEKIAYVLGDNQKKEHDTRFIVMKSDISNLFGNADIEYPDYYEINKSAFSRIEAYEFLK